MPAENLRKETSQESILTTDVFAETVTITSRIYSQDALVARA